MRRRTLRPRRDGIEPGISLVLDGGWGARPKDFTVGAAVRGSRIALPAIVDAEDDGGDIALIVIDGEQESRKLDRLGGLDVYRLVEFTRTRAAEEGATQAKQSAISLVRRHGGPVNRHGTQVSKRDMGYSRHLRGGDRCRSRRPMSWMNEHASSKTYIVA